MIEPINKIEPLREDLRKLVPDELSYDHII